jgi:hypothetical protein
MRLPHFGWIRPQTGPHVRIIGNDAVLRRRGFESPEEIAPSCLTDDSQSDPSNMDQACREMAARSSSKSSATRAESAMKQCGEQWQSAKSAGTTNGATWPQFLAQCRAQLGSGAATAAPTPAPSTQPQTGSLFPWQTPAAPTSAPTAAGNQSVMKQCGAQWQAAKAAGTTGGATWPQFLKSCRAQLASTTSAPPQGGSEPATPAPAPKPAPTQSGSLFPWQRPAAPPAGSAASSGGGSASAQEPFYAGR